MRHAFSILLILAVALCVSAAERDPRWSALRDRHLAQHPVCAACTCRADVVHHVVPVHADPSRELDSRRLAVSGSTAAQWGTDHAGWLTAATNCRAPVVWISLAGNDVVEALADGRVGAYSATAAGAPAWGSYGGKSCLVFDGTNDVVSAGDVLDMGTNGCVFGAWVYLDRLFAADVIGVIGKPVYGLAQGRYAIAVLNNRNIVAVYQSAPNGAVGGEGYGYATATYTSTAPTGQWFHVAARVSRRVGITLYTNGAACATATMISGDTNQVMDVDKPFLMGNYDGGARYLPGSVRNGFYGINLPASTISTIYQRTK